MQDVLATKSFVNCIQNLVNKFCLPIQLAAMVTGIETLHLNLTKPQQVFHMDSKIQIPIRWLESMKYVGCTCGQFEGSCGMGSLRGAVVWTLSSEPATYK